MADEMVRIHIMLPRRVVEAVDRLVGPRKRSAFVAPAVAEKLAHEQLGKALAETRGILVQDAYPEWETPEKTSAWVRELRTQADENTERNIHRRE